MFGEWRRHLIETEEALTTAEVRKRLNESGVLDANDNESSRYRSSKGTLLLTLAIGVGACLATWLITWKVSTADWPRTDELITSLTDEEKSFLALPAEEKQFIASLTDKERQYIRGFRRANEMLANGPADQSGFKGPDWKLSGWLPLRRVEHMARMPQWRMVLSCIVLLTAGGACYAACEAEAAALATAEANLSNAELALIQAELDYILDPNPTTAAALATAEANRDNAQLVHDQAADDYAECIANEGGGPPGMRPVPLVISPVMSENDLQPVGDSILVSL